MTIKQQGGVFGRNPTFNDVEVEGSLSVGGSAIPDPTDIAQLDTAQTFTQSQNITTTAATQLTVKRSGSAGQISAIIFKDGGDAQNRISSSGSELIFGYGPTNTEAARFTSTGIAVPSGKGIDFSATEGSGATSSILNDYERGTFNPDLLNVTKTYTSRTGVYTKIGAFVHCSMYFDIASIDTSDTSVILIGGLPYANTNLRGYGLLDQRNSTVITTPLNNRYVRPYSTTIVSLSGDDSSSDSKYNQLGATSGTFRLYFTYETDS